MSLIAQPKSPTITVLAEALSGSVSAVDVAVAYVTFSGVRELFDHSPLRALRDTPKRFLVGIDWFRSEPSAVNALAKLPKSDVRVVDGTYLVRTGHCQPRKTFHPKAYLVVGGSRTLIVGSANLSGNGLRKSAELSIRTDDAATLASFGEWYDSEWDKATKWEKIKADYSTQYTTAKKAERVVTDDDDIAERDALRVRWVTPEKLRLMRAAQNLWADVGHLHNRDIQGLPGTDLQFSQMTRVFFGCPAKIVPGNTPLLDVPLSMAGAQPQTRPMVFNRSSSMDRLSLPVPGEDGWPPRYDDETLLFMKAADGSFMVKMACGNDRAAWRRKSQASGFVVTMARDFREWGVF